MSNHSGSPATRNLRNVIRLHQTNAGGGVLTSDHRGVIAGLQRRKYRCLAVVTRRELSRGEVSLLLVAPIVVKGEERAVFVVQFQCRIIERSGHVRTR